MKVDASKNLGYSLVDYRPVETFCLTQNGQNPKSQKALVDEG
jgi:hypothetical protein